MEINKRKTKTNSWENECDENELLKEFETEAMEYYSYKALHQNIYPYM